MIKIGILGAGRLGNIHIKQLVDISGFDVIGFYDSDQKTVKEISETYGIKAFSSAEELIRKVDAIDIVTPTVSHYEFAIVALRNFKHIFIEKPVTYSLEEAKQLMKLAEEANVKVQVGHVERFNPALKAIKKYLVNPMFIEAHRLSNFSKRGTDVPVVLDLMIHDIDIVLSIVKSNIKKISASGVSVITKMVDIANARIEFDNGCVANLTASRISLSKMRKIRFFQNDAYFSVDFLNKKADIVKIKEASQSARENMGMLVDLGENGKKEIYVENLMIEDSNAIREELSCFLKSIKEDTPTVVGIEDGYIALDIAYQILEKIKQTNNGF